MIFIICNHTSLGNLCECNSKESFTSLFQRLASNERRRYTRDNLSFLVYQ